MAQTCTFKTERTFQYEAVNSQNIIKNFTTWAVNKIHKTNHHGIDKKVKMYSSVCICDRTTKLLYIYKSVGDSYLISKIKRKKKEEWKENQISVYWTDFYVYFWTEYSSIFLKWKTGAGRSSTITIMQYISKNKYPRETIKHKI